MGTSQADEWQRKPRWWLWLILLAALFLFREDIRSLITELRHDLDPFEIILLISMLILAIRAFVCKDT